MQISKKNNIKVNAKNKIKKTINTKRSKGGEKKLSREEEIHRKEH